MVSECKVCGAKTAGHRQYCPDCRASSYGPGKSRNRITGIGTMKMSEGRVQRNSGLFIVGFLTLLVAVLWTICAVIIFILEYIIKIVFSLLRRINNKTQKIWTINNFERKLWELIKKLWSGSMYLLRGNYEKTKIHSSTSSNYEPMTKTLSRPAPFTYRKKLSHNLRSYGG